MLQVELSTWMDPLVSIEIQNEVVKDDERPALADQFVNILRRKQLDVFVIAGGGLYVAH